MYCRGAEGAVARFSMVFRGMGGLKKYLFFGVFWYSTQAMSERKVIDMPPVGDQDMILPFSLDRSTVRGRIVRLDHVLHDMFSKHDYPHPVTQLLTEIAALSLLLGAMLKYEGLFTLQIKGDGPVSALVADVTNQGHIRAYASFDRDAVKKAAKRKKDTAHNYYHLLGKGYIAFTVDQNIEGAERYQGIVELTGQSITDAIEHYFTQSEQIKAAFRIAVHPQDGMWRAGAIMIQQIPRLGGKEDAFDENGAVRTDIEMPETDDAQEEDWNRTRILLKSCRDDELLSPNLHAMDILYRLFHEEGVRVYTSIPVRHVCRCSHEKVEMILRQLPRSEVDTLMTEEGFVVVTCEFCSKRYSFSPTDLNEVYDEKE